jgi:hypothetical protein
MSSFCRLEFLSNAFLEEIGANKKYSSAYCNISSGRFSNKKNSINPIGTSVARPASTTSHAPFHRYSVAAHTVIMASLLPLTTPNSNPAAMTYHDTAICFS